MYGTPNYYVQQLYSRNKGTNVLNLTENGQVLAGKDSLYASAAWDKATSELILKLVNTSDKSANRTVQLAGAKKLAKTGTLTLLTNDKLDAVNSFENATAVSPVDRQIPVDSNRKTVALTLAPRSLSVVRIKVTP